MIKNIAFDLGGVVLALNYEQAVKRFEEVGLKDARQELDAFEQRGISLFRNSPMFSGNNSMLSCAEGILVQLISVYLGNLQQNDQWLPSLH